MKLRKWFGHREKTSLPETDASDEERLGSSPPPCASHDFGTEQIPEEAISAVRSLYSIPEICNSFPAASQHTHTIPRLTLGYAHTN